MTYCTLTDLQDRFGEPEILQLSDHAGAGTLDETTVDQAIADADAEIDSYLAGVFALPLATIPANLTRIACDITRYRLYHEAHPEVVLERYKVAIRYLELVAQGKITLGLDPPPTLGSVTIAMQSDASVFSRTADA